jgi:geranylgeranylglyceryl phosphate synthase family protein
MSQDEVEDILNTALAGQLMGAKLLYLEAGSGAKIPVSVEIIKAVKETVSIPVIVGGGIKTQTQCKQAYAAGADFIVMGTVFEEG